MKLAILILVPWAVGVVSAFLLYPHMAWLGPVLRGVGLCLALGVVTFLVTGVISYLLICLEIRAETEGSIEPNSTKLNSTYE